MTDGTPMTQQRIGPRQLLTERLYLRTPRAGDGRIVNAAILDSFAELHEWMDWAHQMPSVAESETFAREGWASAEAGEEFPILIFRRADMRLVGASGMHRVEWHIPSVEIGYWCRTDAVGSGYITESTYALARFAFVEMGARRVEIRMDDLNVRSYAVAERLGFPFEGVHRADMLNTRGDLRNTRVYAATSLAEIDAPQPR